MDSATAMVSELVMMQVRDVSVTMENAQDRKNEIGQVSLQLVVDMTSGSLGGPRRSW